LSRTEEIFAALVALSRKQKMTTFSREDIKQELNITSQEWANNYTSRFQGMIEAPTDGAPKVARKFRGVFKRVAKGTYTLTPYGRSLLKSAKRKASHSPLTTRPTARRTVLKT
jgi:hypothetical protein